MCGTLKFENMAAKLGDYVPAKNIRTGAPVHAPWTGWARSEKMGYWTGVAKGEVVMIPAKGFIEKKHEFKVSENSRILGILLGADCYAQGKLQGRAGELKIITREAKTALEKKVHNRWPVTICPDRPGPQEFTGDDVVGEIDS